MYPKIVKMAEVISVWKKEGREQLANYGPIALKSVICKIFASLTKKRILAFVKATRVIDK